MGRTDAKDLFHIKAWLERAAQVVRDPARAPRLPGRDCEPAHVIRGRRLVPLTHCGDGALARQSH